MAELKRSPYQLVALTKLLRNGLGAVLICDGVGVGKTIAAGYILAYLTSWLHVPALVVCPPSLLDKWLLELKSKFRLNAVVIRTREELNLTTDYWNRPNERPRVFILPSSLMAATRGAEFFGPIVFDEIHNYRNAETQSWAAAVELSASAAFRIGLSATPINNGIDDLAAELAILLKLNIHVAMAIVADIWRPGQQQISYPLMTRFSKERLGLHFARRDVHDIQIEVSDTYREEVIAIVKDMRSRPRSESIYRDEITYFRLAASSSRAFSKSTGADLEGEFGKPSQLGKILALFANETVIVFCEFEETTRELEDLIEARPCFVITGAVATFLREGILDQFRKSSNGVLIMTSVGAEGIDLQFCSTLINYDLNWNPMVLEQRIGRIDRIGQEKSVIRIYNCVVEGSIDERIVEALGRKLGLVKGSILEPSTVIGSGSGARLRKSLFTESIFEKELEQAKSLARAVELTSQIIPEDYAMLSSVDSVFCDPDAIANAAGLHPQLPWLREVAEAERWLTDTEVACKKFISVVRRYDGDVQFE